MKNLKKIIQEEIRKVMGTISEENLHSAPSVDVLQKKVKTNDDIIYNYEKGREFANNTLQVDIDNLNSYNLSEYLPKSAVQEKWSFEFDTAVGTTLIVDIEREIRGEISFWTMIFGILYKGENVPTIKDMIEDVKGYDNFIAAVNSGIANKIVTSNY